MADVYATGKKKGLPKPQPSFCADCGVLVWKGSTRCRPCANPLSVERACAGCGSMFKPKRTGNKGIYCSRACAFSDPNRCPADPSTAAPFSAVRFNTCKQCGKQWAAKRATSVCSVECGREFARIAAINLYIKQHAIEVAMREQVSCVECGAMFVSTHGRVACSDRCSSRIVHRVTRGRDKARKHAVAYEPVNWRRVFDRDGWRCQICGKDTPSSARGTRKSNAPELDHRIPLSKGGAHTYSNTQCACRECNGDKGNSANYGQFPLFNHIDS